GATAWADAYYVAFRIPNLLRRLFGEGAFSQAFVPILGHTRSREGDEVTHRLVDAVATVLFWALLLTVGIGIVATPVVVWLMASGLKEFDGAVTMTRWMFPYIGFISLVALAAGVLNTWKHFAIPAATPVLLNLSVIGAAWLLGPRFEAWGIPPAYSLAAGVLVGGVVQLAVQVPALVRVGMLPHIGLSPAALKSAWHHPGVHRVLSQMAPALIGVSVSQLSLIINTQIASHIAVGAVAWLGYADRVMEFPTALLGVALGVVLTPQLALAHGRDDAAGYSALLDWGLRLTLLLTLPCAVALLVFAEPMIASLYHRGAFKADDVHQTVYALMGYGVGLLGLIAVKILAPGFFARQDMRTPVKIAVGVLIFTQLANLVLVPLIGQAGLTVSISLGALLNAGFLLAGLRRLGTYTPSPGWGGLAWRVLLACTLMGGALFAAARGFDWIGLGQHNLQRIGLLAICLAGAATLYFTTLLATGIRPREFMRRG
ncbi:MAG TPA: murein biosynthesis integral membrane protein MurJ, partial [Albitalea sp.]|nr:murein biosynthesis integral membrane protein MurJ [Albitalea sp.]